MPKNSQNFKTPKRPAKKDRWKDPKYIKAMEEDHEKETVLELHSSGLSTF